ncbi:hypothetical protein [Streptomyces sp. NBC_00063]|uniref:hypothetical protein n=1 Tax=Streptomyces sp. NBC_00063 TaxID=2975638 RepID=UPI003D72C4BC
MSDTQFGQAMRSGALDECDFARVRAEVDRRDHAALLDRIPPAGSSTTSLASPTTSSAAPYSTWGRRKRFVSPRKASASAEQLAAIAAEADRRQILAALFPAGQLAADLAPFGDDMLGWAMRYSDEHSAARIAAEFDRRYPPAPALAVWVW